jgi:hypothetical protein
LRATRVEVCVVVDQVEADDKLPEGNLRVVVKARLLFLDLREQSLEIVLGLHVLNKLLGECQLRLLDLLDLLLCLDLINDE